MARITKIQMRRGTAAAWTSADPTLAAGELGVETDTRKFKIGDGSTAWTGLAYEYAAATIDAHLADASDAHDASAISVVDAGTYFTGTDVEAVLQELGAAGGGSGDVATDTIWDAKGDIAAGTGSNAAARLPVGANGYALHADSGQSSGLIWLPGAPVKLYDYEVSGTDKASIDTNVDGTTVASFAGYDILEIWMIGRTDEAVTASTCQITFNNDTGSNYDIEEMRGRGTSVAAAAAVAQANFAIELPGNSASANYAASVRASVVGYASNTFYKTIEIVEGYNHATSGSNFAAAWFGTWRNTATVTRIKVAAPGSNKLKVGSRLIVCGR